MDPARQAIAHVRAQASGGPLDRAYRIDLHFHPARAGILRALARDGVYRSQFETGTTNGGLTAHPGGDRWRWESRLFGGAYDEAPPQSRPVYGALDVLGRPGGASPRFGSAWFRLREHVLDRATFCYPDSYVEPVVLGTADLAGDLVTMARAGTRDPLDDYVEAQVHGGVRLSTDVEALVLDPCFRGTEVETDANTLPCQLEWHPGFALKPAVAPPDYRTPESYALLHELAEDGVVTPYQLAGVDGQVAKHAWHYVARFGSPA